MAVIRENSNDVGNATVSWNNRGIGVGSPVEDSYRVSEGKLLESIKGKEGFSNKKREIISKEKRDSPTGKEELTETVLST